MSLKHGLLGLLTYGDMSGYDLEKLFKRSIGFFWKAQISQIYRDLHDMEKKGWLTSDRIIQTDKPNKQVFHITESGMSELDRWLTDYDVSGDFNLRIGILVRVFFSLRRPKEELIFLLERYRQGCQKALNELNLGEDAITNVYKPNLDGASMAKSFDPIDCDGKPDPDNMLYLNAALSYGRHYYAMQMQWCEETIASLKNISE